jgi:hypothetical protein
MDKVKRIKIRISDDYEIEFEYDIPSMDKIEFFALLDQSTKDREGLWIDKKWINMSHVVSVEIEEEV